MTLKYYTYLYVLDIYYERVYTYVGRKYNKFDRVEEQKPYVIMFGFFVYENMKHEIFNRMNIRANRSFENIHPPFLSASVINNSLLDELLYTLLRHRLYETESRNLMKLI